MDEQWWSAVDYKGRISSVWASDIQQAISLLKEKHHEYPWHKLKIESEISANVGNTSNPDGRWIRPRGH